MSNTLMELRKCCNHPYLLKGIEDSLPALATADLQAALEAMVAASGKLDLVDRMLTKLIPRGHRTLIYSQFTTVLNILEDWLVGKGWGYQRIDGAVSKFAAARVPVMSTGLTLERMPSASRAIYGNSTENFAKCCFNSFHTYIHGTQKAVILHFSISLSRSYSSIASTMQIFKTPSLVRVFSKPFERRHCPERKYKR